LFGLWFYKDVAPDGAVGGSGGTGAETQRLFLPEPATRKTRLTRAAKPARMPVLVKIVAFRRPCIEIIRV
jgi:hypothetical protein